MVGASVGRNNNKQTVSFFELHLCKMKLEIPTKMLSNLCLAIVSPRPETLTLNYQLKTNLKNCFL